MARKTDFVQVTRNDRYRPSNTSLGEKRFRNEKTLSMNPVSGELLRKAAVSAIVAYPVGVNDEVRETSSILLPAGVIGVSAIADAARAPESVQELLIGVKRRELGKHGEQLYQNANEDDGRYVIDSKGGRSFGAA